MAKGYWVVTYRSIRDMAALAAYGKLAVPAVEAAGGQILARGGLVKAYEAGVSERTVNAGEKMHRCAGVKIHQG